MYPDDPLSMYLVRKPTIDIDRHWGRGQVAREFAEMPDASVDPSGFTQFSYTYRDRTGMSRVIRVGAFGLEVRHVDSADGVATVIKKCENREDAARLVRELRQIMCDKALIGLRRQPR